MDGILRHLDLEELIEAFKENGVGPREAVILTDVEFVALGVTRIGDRARIREKCRKNISGEASASPVVKRLKEMVKGRRVAQPGPSRKPSSTLRVHVGWKHRAKHQKSHKQVVAGKGGGTYDLDLARDADMSILKKSIINVFFHQGKNEVQQLDIADLQSYVSTFSGHMLQPNLESGEPFTLEGYFEEVKTHPVRLYLVTTDEQEDSNTDEDDSPPDVSRTGSNSSSIQSSYSSNRNRSRSNNRNQSNSSNRNNSNNSSSSSRHNTSGNSSMNNRNIENSNSSNNNNNRSNGSSSSKNNSSSSNSSSSGNSSSNSHGHMRNGSSMNNVNNTIIDVDMTASSSGMETKTVPTECPMQPDTPTITFPRNTLDLDHAAHNAVPETIYILDDTEEDLGDIVIAAVETRQTSPLETQASERSCADIIASLMSETVEGDPTTIVVHRRRILNSTMREVKSSSFSFSSPLQVVFSGEDAEDGGGPRREFFRLLLEELVKNSGMFQVRENKAMFTYNINHLEERGYKLAGQVVLWSLSHGGPGIAALCPSLFAAMVGKDVDMADIDCLPEQTTRAKLEKLMSCTDEAEFSEAVLDLADWILEQGVTKVHNMTFVQRDSLVKRLFTHCIYHRVHSAVRQFTEGLGPLWEQVTQNPAEMNALFVYEPRPLTVGDFRKLYDIEHSPEGANNRVLEEDTNYCWEVFIQKCADINTDISLEDVLQFWTAAREVPPCGFDNQPKIEFYPKVTGIRRFPSSSTCWPILWLPRGMEDPDEFDDLMTYAIKGCSGFGKV